jgi:hypothetical protein
MIHTQARNTMKLSVQLMTMAMAMPAARAFSAAVIVNPAHELKSEWTTPLAEGAALPNVNFEARVRIESEDQNPFDWKTITTADYFAGKRCVLFSLPGAFTPTCSNTHLPGYEAAYEEMKTLGVDEVYCKLISDSSNERVPV